MLRKISPILLLILLTSLTQLRAQVVITDPVFPKQTDTVTVTFDATLGNGALTGYIPVYAHTGVITNLSSGPTDWRHVQGNWGTNDPNVIMTSLGNNKHSITYHMPTFYGFGTETVSRMAFVFRNASGSVVGREADGSDIFVPVYGPGLFAKFVTPGESSILASMGGTIDIWGAASETATLTIFDNGSQIANGSGKNLNYTLNVTTAGNHMVELVADNGTTTARDTFYYAVNPSNSSIDPPSGTELGINYLNDSTVRLRLYAPNKSYVYVLGDFNNYLLNTNYYMNKSVDGNTYWLDLHLTPGQVYTYQYLVDGSIKQPDPYSTLVLDPSNDPWIADSTYPDMPDYPTGKTTGIVTVLEPGKPAYVWQNPTFNAPDKEDLVVYELLLRDFLNAHDYQTLLDTLDYLDNLGINAIEIMPVNEFEGNLSWGYNPSFHMALDKYYGPADQLKAVIDECHSRGIAVILDVVYNHAFSQSPLCKLYWDDVNFRPAADNPWLNVTAKHDFNVGYDFNHESQATKDWVDRVMKYWITDFKVDGFRFDLSKGFTQNYTVGNLGAWGAYDQSRINLIERMGNTCWSVNPDFYMILEHFADNSEEKELAAKGMMLWGNLNYNYNQASMGFSQDSDFGWISWKNRGWGSSKVMGYMESHDEERLMYKNLQFGNSSGGYNVKTLATALARQELVGSFFFTIPGPKMIWEFGELGYDYSLVYGGSNVASKPIKWDYFQNANRQHLYLVWKNLIWLKTNYSSFRTSNYDLVLNNTWKRINLYDNNINVVVLGNFDVVTQNAYGNFPTLGKWYEFFSGDSMTVFNANDPISLAPGEYRIYTDVKLPSPVWVITDAKQELAGPAATTLQLFPNPAGDYVFAGWEQPRAGQTTLRLLNLMGQEVSPRVSVFCAAGPQTHRFETSHLPACLYLIELQVEGHTTIQKLVVE
ncbi:MAG: 1,4-alpha-glucan-branching protein [Bacteroidia bacterium]|nr:1,4-alpha-glucan-branching protein [Bacteroidia bacterium]